MKNASVFKKCGGRDRHTQTSSLEKGGKKTWKGYRRNKGVKGRGEKKKP